jgi:hypothetical protein
VKLIKIISVLLFVMVASCSTLKLEPADFAWPVESVLVVDENGNVTEERYSIIFNTKSLFFEETENSSSYKDKEIRILRDTQGFYFITSENFKNVYVFEMDEGAMELDNTILISELGIQGPALNQRSPYIELISNGKSILLTNDGIVKDKK